MRIQCINVEERISSSRWIGFSVSFRGTNSTGRVAICARGTSSVKGENGGYACIYEYDETGWARVGNGLLGGSGESLGYAVRLTPDASRMTVGAPNKLINGSLGGGLQIVDIYGEELVPIGEIDGKEGDNLGFSVAISFDGSLVYGGTTATGIVRVFGEST